jgi:hypothetical protein
LGGRVLGTADLGVVGADDGGVGVDERGAGVDDTRGGFSGGGSANGESRRGVSPETLADISVDVGERTGVFGGVDVALIMKSALSQKRFAMDLTYRSRRCLRRGTLG